MAKKKAIEKSIRGNSQPVSVKNVATPKSGRTRVERAYGSSANPLATRPDMLLPLGVHRSGTSVATRLLECLGAVNSTNLMPTVPGDIEKGSLEDYDVYQFNEFKFLPRLRTSWRNLAQVDWSNLPTKARSKFALEALEILRRNYSPSNPLSVLNEHRIGILLPFWLSVLRHAGYNPKVVCVVRNPASVARSLAKSDGFSIAHGGMLYTTQWLSILPCIQDLPVAFVQFDEVFASPTRVLKTVAAKLGIPVPLDFDSRVTEFSSSFLNPSLRHNTLERLDLPLETDLPSIAIDLYETLIAAAQSQNIKRTSKFIASAGHLFSAIQPVLSEFDMVIGEGAGCLSLPEGAVDIGGAFQKLADAEKNLSFAAIEKTNLEKQISELSSRFERLQAENQKLCDVRNALDRSLEVPATGDSATPSTSWGLGTGRDALAKEKEEHAVRLSELSSEGSNPPSRLESLTEVVRSLELENAALSKERDDLISENARLDSDAERYASVMEDRFKELAQLTKEFASLQDTLSAERQAADVLSLQTATNRGQLCEHTTALHKQLSESLSENATLTSRLCETASERDFLLARKSELDARIVLFEEESGTNASRLSQLEAEHSRLIDSHAILSAERDAMSERLQQMERELEDSILETGSLRENILAMESDRNALGGRLEGLEQEHSELIEQYNRLSTENVGLSSARDELLRKLEELTMEVQERSSETILLGKRILGIEGERDELGVKLEVLEGELGVKISEIDDLRRCILATEGERDALESHAESLTEEVQERFNETAALGKRILDIEAEGAERAAKIQSRMDAMAARWTWKLGAPFRFSWDKARNAAVKISRLPIALRILLKHRHTGFLDNDWYLATNPDVKQSAAQPLPHFAFHGAFEGRAPHAAFREADYISRNPSLVSRRKPPLVHYALKGWKQP